jgi:RNA polymerase sigma-70 factor (ECF subfamily)
MGRKEARLADTRTPVPFTDVARPLLPQLYSLARRLAGTDAEDLVQECLLRAYRSYTTLRDPTAASKWLSTILVNCARDRYRHSQRLLEETSIDDIESFSLFRMVAEYDPFPYSDSLHLDFLQRFGPEDVRAVLRDLPLLYRVPLVLVHMQDMATKQAARMLGVPLGTLLSRLHRGRKLFEKRLWDYAVANDLLKTPLTAMEHRP